MKLQKSFLEKNCLVWYHIRRAAVSIPSNIVEGKARGSNKEFKRFLLMSRGSLEELKYQLLLAKDLKYISDIIYEEVLKMAKDVGRMLNGLMVSLDKGEKV
jgi:four helix bundle protein